MTMEKKVLLEVCYEAWIIFNALFIILWIFLAIFPGLYALYQGDIMEGLQEIVINWWFYLFIITLGGGLLFREWINKEKTKKENAS
jgi:TM2 domain-containing membrane protein YozV